MRSFGHAVGIASACGVLPRTKQASASVSQTWSGRVSASIWVNLSAKGTLDVPYSRTLTAPFASSRAGHVKCGLRKQTVENEKLPTLLERGPRLRQRPGRLTGLDDDGPPR